MISKFFSSQILKQEIKNCVQYLKVFNFSTSQVVFRDFMLRWERSEETELPVLTVVDAKSQCFCPSGDS